MHLRPRRFAAAVAAPALVTAVLVGAGARSPLLGGPRPATAEVTRLQGFSASVDGFRGWFGSYGMGELGVAWCVDHGPPPPDPALAYVHADLEERAVETRRAMAWALGAHGRDVDATGAAALVLVLHDLMGADYPSGRLSLDDLSPDRLQGFDGHESAVLDRARAIRADAVAHASHEPPLSMHLFVEGDLARGAGTVVARVVDTKGSGVAGLPVTFSLPGVEPTGPADALTDGAGAARAPFRASPGSHAASAAAVAPDLLLQSFRPTQGDAQRVARPAVVELAAGVAIEVPRPARLSVRKAGDAEPYVPVAGALFTVAADGGAAGQLVTDDSGATASLELPPGRYLVEEAAAPPGYTAGGPWDVVLAPGEARVLEVANQARRGALVAHKVDALTGNPVAGATFAAHYDADRDGRFETELQPFATGVAPFRLDGLLPGDYEVHEVRPPPHYRAAPPRRVSVAPGAVASVTVADTPTASAAFVKVPVGEVDDSAPSLAGAALAVRDEQGRGVASCVTGADGRCRLAPDALDGGRSYCVTEEKAPPGWERAGPVCFTTGGAGSVTTVHIEERRLAPAPPAAPAETAEVEGTAEVVPAVAAAVPTGPAESAPAAELPRTGSALVVQAALATVMVATGSTLRAIGSRPAKRARRRARALPPALELGGGPAVGNAGRSTGT